MLKFSIKANKTHITWTCKSIKIYNLDRCLRLWSSLYNICYGCWLKTIYYLINAIDLTYHYYFQYVKWDITILTISKIKNLTFQKKKKKKIKHLKYFIVLTFKHVCKIQKWVSIYFSLQHSSWVSYCLWTLSKNVTIYKI